MKSFRIKFVFTTMFFILTFKVTFSQCDETNCLGYYQENNSSAIITHYHNTSTGGNCIGYALAETQQSYLGPICGQTKSISINEAYAKNYWMTWGFYNKLTFNGYVQTNDILIWDLYENDLNMNLRHAAVVNYSGSGYINIRWIDASLADNTVHYSSLLSSNNYAAPGYGSPAYVVRRNPNNKTYGYAITLKTSFYGGTLPDV